MISWTKEYLEKNGVSKNNIKHFMMGYTVVGTGIFIGVWRLSYRYHPTSRFLNSIWFLSRKHLIEKKYPKINQNIIQTHRKINKIVHDSTIITKISELIGVQRKQFAKSIIEAIIINKVGFIVFLPIELSLGYVYMNYKHISSKDL